ncbi:MAG: terminase small subunit [Lactobacillus sp.]|nr:MAG: terminase small subunit [Lactobacillus sp.]
MKLTIKQQAFADYYIETGNATQSAIRAKYSEKTAGQMGAENLRKPQIQEYIKQRTEQIKNDRLVSLEDAMALLSDIANRKEVKSHSKIIDNLKGEVKKDVTYVHQPDIDQQTKALEHLVKIQGGFDQHPPQDDVNINITDWGDDNE